MGLLLMSLFCFQGIKKAELLVRDLVLVQLIGKDFSELWSMANSRDFSDVVIVFSGY